MGIVMVVAARLAAMLWSVVLVGKFSKLTKIYNRKKG